MDLIAFAATFAPYDQLVATLLPHVEDAGSDGAHDLGHLRRVWNNIRRIQAQEGGDLRILAATVILHDCVLVEKDSPLRAQASTLSARKAREVLLHMAWSAADAEAVAHAVQAHSFSAGFAPQSLEARIMQDADRLDAIGAIGVARCFYIAGRMGSALYDAVDPQAQVRPLDDRRFALDHFSTKLFQLADRLQTETGCRIAQERQRRMRHFVEDLLAEC